MSTSRFAPLVPVAAALVTVLHAQQAQAPQQQPPTFRAGTRTVMVPAVVTDDYGQPVVDLRREDFEIRDNGKPQVLTLFDRQLLPMSAVLLIDGCILTPAAKTATEFVLRMLPGDRLRVGSFDDLVDLKPGFETDRDVLLDFIANEFNIRIGPKKVVPEKRWHVLWDAMTEAIIQLETVEGRRVLFVVADGTNSNGFRTYEDVRWRAGRSDIAIVFVKVSRLACGGKQLPDASYERLAQDTGGAFVSVDPRYPPDVPFTYLSLDLRTQYVLGFTAAVLDEKAHDLDVRVKRRGVQVRARKSYVASALPAPIR